MKYDDNFEKIIDYIFNSEGGYVNHKYDRGGATNYGVTQTTYNAWRKQKGLPIKNVKDISKAEAKNLYYEEFWKGTGASEVEDLREAYLLFDTSVICGPYNAKVMYKKSDGNIYQFLKERAKFHNVDIEDNPEQQKFKEGWFNRLKDLENNMNEIVNKGYYVPPYQNEITPLDEKYNGSLKKIDTSKLSKTEIQNLRNKYLYLQNKSNKKNKSGTTTGQAAPINNSDKLSSYTQPSIKLEPPKTTSQKISDGIRAQYHSKIEKNNQLLKKIFGKHFKQTGSGQGQWVTINGTHVFIED